MIYGADLAYIHHVGFGGLAAAAAPALGGMLREAGIRDGLVLDLGCGTGILARALTERGYDVLGIDVSAHMIERARGVAPRSRFIRASIRNTALPPCRAVLAIGESLSYLTARSRRPPDLGPLFARVGRALLPGGLFVFDLVVAGRPLMSYRTWHLGPDWAVLVDVSESAPTRVVTRGSRRFEAVPAGIAGRMNVTRLACTIVKTSFGFWRRRDCRPPCGVVTEAPLSRRGGWCSWRDDRAGRAPGSGSRTARRISHDPNSARALAGPPAPGVE